MKTVAQLKHRIICGDNSQIVMYEIHILKRYDSNGTSVVQVIVSELSNQWMDFYTNICKIN